MNLLKQYELAMQGDFELRIQQAMVKAAIDLSTSAPDYRLASYITQVLNAPEQYRRRFAFGVASQPEIGLSNTDAEIQVAVNSLFSAYAGAFNITPPAPVAAPAEPLSLGARILKPVRLTLRR